MKQHIIIFLSLAVALCGYCSLGYAQTAEDGDNGTRATIYFDLAAGPVTILPKADHSGYVYRGYIYQNNGGSIKTLTGAHSNSNSYYVYQSSKISGSPGYYTGTGYAGTSGDVRIPNYSQVMSPDNSQTWADYVTGNKHAEDIIALWSDIPHHPLTAVKRDATENRLHFLADAAATASTPDLLIDLTLDNIWCSKLVDSLGAGPMMVKGNNNGKRMGMNLKLKGDNFITRIVYDTRGANDYFNVTSSSGNGSENGSLTITPPSPLPYTKTHAGGPFVSVESQTLPHYGLAFKGGTVYAATPLYYRYQGSNGWGYSGVGGGNNTEIHMQITGGRLTVVARGTGAAIGGGGGGGSAGGAGYITISGGKTYAYHFGVVSKYSLTEPEFVAAVCGTAIGGGASFGSSGNVGDVTISGNAYVYAESVGGAAIGGGGSAAAKGGVGNFSMPSGTPTVIAKSVPGDISCPWSINPPGEDSVPTVIHVDAGTSIGGGNGGNANYMTTWTIGPSGGDATIDIKAGTLSSGSIGGGNKGIYATADPLMDTLTAGTAQVTISGGSIQGQFIMAKVNGSTPPSFSITGGTIDNVNLLTSNGFYKVKENGGAVYMEDGTCTINGGTIKRGSATLGGAIYMNAGTCNMLNGIIGGNSLSEGNTASQYGGGIYMAGGNFSMTGGDIQYNSATNHDGGGVYIASGGRASFTGKDGKGTIVGNQALNGNGGGFYVDPRTTEDTDYTYINSVYIASNKAINGGGAYVASGSIQSHSSIYNGNIATGNGGAVYAVGSNTIYHVGWGNCFLVNNQAVKGGAIYADAKLVKLGTVIVGAQTETVEEETVYVPGGNTASDKGGGIYAVGDVEFDSFGNGKVMYNSAENDGGGIYVESGDVSLRGSLISNNRTESGNGGGIYVGGGDLTVNASTLASNSAANNGGAVCATGGVIHFNNWTQGGTTHIPTVTGNTAINGGVLYMEGGTCDVEAGTLGGSHANRNKASDNGGAIYANGGTVNIKYANTTDGEISYNTAGISGGALYVSSTGTLTMTGNVTLSHNHVPAGKHGGGVYLAGVVQIGASGKKTILAQDNFAYGTVDTDPGSVTVNAENRNNVYLQDPKVSTGSRKTSVITVIENGLTTSTRVGFSVPRNYVPVIYCAHSSTSGAYLKSFLLNPPSKAGAMYGTVFDDSERYQTVYGTSSPYHEDYIFLSGGAWVERITTLAQAGAGFSVSDDTVTVSTPEALAYVISYVNGLNDVSETHTGINIKLDADIDIGEFAWTPIAGRNKANTADLTFTGTFDGQGHTISNLYAQLLPNWSGDGQGLFGNVGSNAVIKDVNLQDAIITTGSVSSGTYYLGAIAKKMSGGSVSGCVADVNIETQNPNSYMGGLVGQSAGAIQNCIATADMTGYQMGGLVGANSGDLYNSYAYAKFTPQSGSTNYMGGLVGVNTGRVENCYSRVQGTAPTSTYFGWLAGNNTAASGKGLYYCYSPNATYVATVSGTTSGNQTGLSTFGVTVANAYEYRVRDNQVAATNDYAPTYDAHHLADYQLKKYLNNWVNQDSAHKAIYARWTRPTTQAINADYPLLKLQSFNAVAATSGKVTLDYGDINSLLTNYVTADNSILFYGVKEGMNSNSGSAAPLYIDEDAVLTHTGAIQAHVGVTIDNSACHDGANPSFADEGYKDYIDWHFFSSALSNSLIGLHYGDENPYGLGVYPSWNATFTNANGYFPINLNNYYDDWDLYAYCEPDYHWINYKRNSASHWHDDWPGIHIYPFSNDTEFVPGKGYMVALKEEGYLQAYGTLNTNSGVGSDTLSVPVTCTSSIGWTTREGHNLLGNPYQSYLDFDEFASENASLWNNRRPFYIIIDEDNKGYVLYTVGQSPNPKQASRFLHPHQGFMIDSDINGWARFDNGMRTTSTTTTGATPVTWDGSFRGGEDAPCYPLVNLMATDASGNRDIVTVELGRPDKGGALKQDAMHSGKGSLWCRYEDEDYALVFTQPGLEYANIRFAADEDAEFTMTWSTHNGDFSYLHLIDNMTGADIDCLSQSEYKFSARESDYNSRFRLVFDYTGLEENEDDSSTSSGTETFAYYSNGEIHLTDANDDASLQIIDMTGRIIVSRDGVHTVSTNGMAAGVYVLRLTTANGTRTQKIILN